jgi:hypothetical protein
VNLNNARDAATSLLAGHGDGAEGDIAMTQENIIQTVESVTIDVKVDTKRAFALVAEGTTLDREIKEKAKRLEEIKAELREFAKAPDAFSVTETGTVEIRDPESQVCAQVIPCKDTPAVIKGTDLKALKALLTTSQFDLMFREVIQMQAVKDFEEAFNAAPKKVQNQVKKFVAWRPNAPQVKFSK